MLANFLIAFGAALVSAGLLVGLIWLGVKIIAPEKLREKL